MMLWGPGAWGITAVVQLCIDRFPPCLETPHWLVPAEQQPQPCKRLQERKNKRSGVQPENHCSSAGVPPERGPGWSSCWNPRLSHDSISHWIINVMFSGSQSYLFFYQQERDKVNIIIPVWQLSSSKPRWLASVRRAISHRSRFPAYAHQTIPSKTNISLRYRQMWPAFRFWTTRPWTEGSQIVVLLKPDGKGAYFLPSYLRKWGEQIFERCLGGRANRSWWQAAGEGESEGAPRFLVCRSAHVVAQSLSIGPGGHPCLQRMTNWISGVINYFMNRVLYVSALYQMQNQARLEQLVGVTNCPQVLMLLLKSHPWLPTGIWIFAHGPPKPHRSWPLQTSPFYLPILPFTSSLYSPPALDSFKLVLISGPVYPRQAWNPHPQDLQISLPQKGPPQLASWVTL